ncbi:hypothetical protein Tco_0902823, partial [Tanacetum coccineum]
CGGSANSFRGGDFLCDICVDEVSSLMKGEEARIFPWEWLPTLANVFAQEASISIVLGVFGIALESGRFIVYSVFIVKMLQTMVSIHGIGFSVAEVVKVARNVLATEDNRPAKKIKNQFYGYDLDLGYNESDDFLEGRKISILEGCEATKVVNVVLVNFERNTSTEQDDEHWEAHHNWVDEVVSSEAR